MNQSSLTYHITAEFLSALRAEGRTVGIDKHLQIQTLLKQLPDVADAETLKLALIPLIAQSPQEQERLYETFDQCVKRVEERQRAIETDPSVTSSNIPKVGNFWNVVKAVILLVLLLAIGGGLWWKANQKLPEPIVNKQDSSKFIQDTIIDKGNKNNIPSSPFIENKPYPFPNHLEEYAIKPVSPTQAWLSEHWTSLRWILALVLTALLLAIWRFRAWKRRKLVAQQDPNDKSPYIWNINIEGIEPILMGNSLDRLTQQLRRRAQSDTLRMDLERTVHATIEQGGLPVFKYKQETNPTDYLLLIDRQSVRNHRAQLFDTLYELFKAQEIEIARYFFDSDVRVCYSEDYPNGIALADLQQRYYQSRLLIVGTGAQLLSPLSGKAAAWTSVFSQWKDRALFSPKPLKAWGYDERQLAAAFTTLPATLQGLGFWVEELDAGADARFDGWEDKIDDAPTAPILPDDNDPLPILDLYFEPDMLRWIAACAIYPTLHWDLTLWLAPLVPKALAPSAPKGGTLQAELAGTFPFGGQGGLTFDNLMQLCRLSWFVKGEMPDATRTALLNWLEQTDAPLLTRLRAAIALELQKNPPPKDSAAWDKFRLNIALNEWLSTTDAEKKKELEAEVSQLLEKGAEPDFTVIKYLQKPRTALDFIVPDAWKKYVYPSGFAALGWLKEWKDLPWLLPLFLVGLVGLFYPYQFDTYNCSKDRIVSLTTNEKTLYFCLDEPFGHAVYYEELIRKDLLVARDTLVSSDGSVVDGFNFFLIQDSLNKERILNGREQQDTAIHRLLNECNHNFAVDFYRLAKSYYDINLSNSTNTLIVAALNDTINQYQNEIQELELKLLQTQIKNNKTINNVLLAQDLDYLSNTKLKFEVFLQRIEKDYPQYNQSKLVKKDSICFYINIAAQFDSLDYNIKKVQEYCNPSNKNIPIPLTNNLEMVEVKGGTFQMGSNDGHDSEKPIHRVKLSDFAIGKYEVTVGQYLQFCTEKNTNWPEWLEKANDYHVETGKNPYYKNLGYQRKGSENLPIVGVSWDDATAYCQWLSSKTGKNYRLPTEAEWEYAARGGNQSKGYKYSGSNTIGDVAWYSDKSGSKTHTVGTKGTNELGIHDMSGNVWEWCSDWYDENYYKNSAAQNPKGAQSGSLRVLRGGSWYSNVNNCRSSFRNRTVPNDRFSYFGFRLARD